MKRWTLRIFLFLLLLGGGAIVNVAVAWGSAWLINPVARESGRRYIFDQQWLIIRDRSFSAGRVVALGPADAPWLNEKRLDDEPLPTWTRWPEQLDVDAMGWRVVDVRGWPMYAMRARWSSRQWASGYALPPRARAGSSSNTVIINDLRALPLEIIWPGFAINTVFYACILWLLFAGPFVVRRWRRIRRGLCPKCAYDLRGRGIATEVCPECGTAHAVPLKVETSKSPNVESTA